MRKRILCLLAAAVILAGCAVQPEAPAYADPEQWAYFPGSGEEGAADVFFVCPTVYFGDDHSFNMSLTDEAAKADFLGAINMEKEIYDSDARFFAPYYRQAGLNVYEMDPAEREQYLELAYADVREAFQYYLDNENNGRPIILAGFSQGADMSLRLMKEFFAREDLSSQLIACYAIGWAITDEEMRDNPHLRFAQDEDDTGVIVSFNSEDPTVEDSVIVPRGSRTLAINPLSWRTDTAPADKERNEGACFTETDGSIGREISEFTGAYIDPVRGTLKVTDVNAADYPPQLDIFPNGVYHVYDYQFFFRNLQENVWVRSEAFLQAQELQQAA